MAFNGSVWRQYGYREDLYSTDPIPVGGDGPKLLVGREKELKKIGLQLESGASVIALEGDYGVGKSSLSFVAAYEASQWRSEGGPLFLPANSRLSIKPEDTRETFEKKVMRVVASTLIGAADILHEDGRSLLGIDAMNKWLNEPELVSRNGQVNVTLFNGPGGGAGFGESRVLNESDGFDDIGMMQLVDKWLSDIFPDRENGGVILFLENLEELGDSATALRVMEPLRDPIFKRSGLRWIITGAEGMVRTAFSSPKMTGVFLNPIDVHPLNTTDAPAVISARERIFRIDDDATPPVSDQAFASIYRSLGCNLRYSLNLAERFTLDRDLDEMLELTLEERDQAFFDFVLEESNLIASQYAKRVTKKDWEVFVKIVEQKGGSCSPQDWPDFGYSDMSPFLVRINKLNDAGLVNYGRHDTDGRRRTISLTDHGRLAYFRRSRGLDA